MRTAWIAAAVFVMAFPPAAEAAELKAFQSFRDCVDCPEMVAIPPGTFMMGWTEEEAAREGVDIYWNEDERPQHEVRIGSWFAIGKYEVSRLQFAAFVEATGREVSGCRVWVELGMAFDSSRSWRSPEYPQTESDLVVCVSWDDAIAYADWLSEMTGERYGLASEAQWEYAARAGTPTPRFWGDDREQACRYANVADLRGANVLQWEPEEHRIFSCSDGYEYTSPVGSFAPNGFRLHDMLGNVWEWVADCHSESYAEGPTTEAPVEWLERQVCFERVIRGGSWINGPWGTGAADRVGEEPVSRVSNVGFRVMRVVGSAERGEGAARAASPARRRSCCRG